MDTDVLLANSPDAIIRALDVLISGGLVAFPTDTVYGVGALAFNSKSIEAIYIAKNRPTEKAIPVLLGDAEDLERVASDIPILVRKLASRFWPGPLTIVVHKLPGLPEVLSSTSTVAVRLPDHPVARALLRAAGPMAVTSANISGKQSPTSAQEVLEQLGGRIALIIDGGKTPGGVPSTLVDCTGDKMKVLREGPIKEEELLSALGSRG